MVFNVFLKQQQQQQRANWNHKKLRTFNIETHHQQSKTVVNRIGERICKPFAQWRNNIQNRYRTKSQQQTTRIKNHQRNQIGTYSKKILTIINLCCWGRCEEKEKTFMQTVSHEIWIKFFEICMSFRLVTSHTLIYLKEMIQSHSLFSQMYFRHLTVARNKNKI